MNKLNTFVLQALNSPDVIIALYRSKHISAFSNPEIVDCEEAAMQFVELYNILHKILVFFGIFILANSRRDMDNVVVRVL